MSDRFRVGACFVSEGFELVPLVRLQCDVDLFALFGGFGGWCGGPSFVEFHAVSVEFICSKSYWATATASCAIVHVS